MPRRTICDDPLVIEPFHRASTEPPLFPPAPLLPDSRRPATRSEDSSSLSSSSSSPPTERRKLAVVDASRHKSPTSVALEGFVKEDNGVRGGNPDLLDCFARLSSSSLSSQPQLPTLQEEDFSHRSTRTEPTAPLKATTGRGGVETPKKKKKKANKNSSSKPSPSPFTLSPSSRKSIGTALPSIGVLSSSPHDDGSSRQLPTTGTSIDGDTDPNGNVDVNITKGSTPRPVSKRNIAILAEWTQATRPRIADPAKPSSDSKIASTLTTLSNNPSPIPPLTTPPNTFATPDSTSDMVNTRNPGGASTGHKGGTTKVKAEIKAAKNMKSRSRDPASVNAMVGTSNRVEKSTAPQNEATGASILKKPPSPTPAPAAPALAAGATDSGPLAVQTVDLSNLRIPPPALSTSYPNNLKSIPPTEITANLKPPPPTSADPPQATQRKPTGDSKLAPSENTLTRAKPSPNGKASPSRAAAPSHPAVAAASATSSSSSDSKRSFRSERTLVKRAPPPPAKSSGSLPSVNTPAATSNTSLIGSSSAVAAAAAAASRPGEPSPHRSTPHSLSDLDAAAKDRDTRGPSSSASLPGAYLVQGSNVELAPTGVLSTHRRTTLDDVDEGNGTVRDVAGGSEICATLVETEDAEAGGGSSHRNRKPPKKKKASRESSSKGSKKGLVVAAELTEDVEAKIEREVQRRLLEQTTKADIISIDHGNQYSHRVLLPAAEEVKMGADLKDIHKPKGVREKLFGDVRQSVDIAASPECIRKRDYLQWTVKRNPTTSQWVASVMTNQQAMQEGDTIEMELSKVSYSAVTQEEAYETGLANATPMMQSLDESPICFICKAKFALFRRACNCRNCGVCVCSGCATTWPSKMIPETYLNKKDKATVSACIACDWLANSFQEALLDGNYKAAIDLYNTGNINLRSPFCLDKKGEHLYPVHLAILGGNLKLVRWLVEERFCPLRIQKKKGKKVIDNPIQSSKGRSPLEIALLHQRVDIVHYLVAEMNQSLFEVNVVNSNVALANFTSLLTMLPPGFFDGRQLATTSVPMSGQAHLSPTFSFSGSDNCAERRPSI